MVLLLALILMDVQLLAARKTNMKITVVGRLKPCCCMLLEQSTCYAINTKSGSSALTSITRLEQEEFQDKFVVAMDNYFTLPRTIKKLCDNGIGVVGTTRFKKGWPPVPLRNIDPKK